MHERTTASFSAGFVSLIASLSIVLAACDTGAPQASPGSIPARLTVAGQLEEKDISEASGLAASQRHDDLLWLHNDSGAKARLYAASTDGSKRGRIKLEDADNRDWEDMASFVHDGVPYLLVADVGDNDTRHDFATLYVVEEPDLADDDKPELEPAWRIDFMYPDGPRDAEAVAVDAANERVFVLSKRDVPAVLYSLPLLPVDGENFVTAERVGPVSTLPQPAKPDLEFAQAIDSWHWQPTGMDIARDGSAVAILTYAAVYYYPRRDGESIYESLQRLPLAFDIRNVRDAESIAFGADSRTLFVSVEKKHAPLLRIDMGEVRQPHEVSVMTFNVENLFDNVDDEGKVDETYLSLAAKQAQEHIDACNEIAVESWRNSCLYLDWSDAAIDYKLGVIAAAILQVDDGRGPDIVALQEVENIGILERLRTERLAHAGYGPPILIEGQDNRGIDVAFLSRLPVVGEPQLHAIRFADHPEREGDTRGVLQATFGLPDGGLLTGFAVHFPAPFHPTEMREVAYEHLAALRAALPDDHNVFAAGDFNTTGTEVAETGILDRLARPHWIIAHEIGCKGCPGTNYYARGDSWSFLDMLLYSPARGENATWQIRANSVHIANATDAQTTPDGTPRRFESEPFAGVSDHWPLVMTLEPATNQ